MKKVLTLCLVCIMLCMVLASCNQSDVTVPAGMQLASDPEILDFHLFVPQGWTVDMRTGTTTAYYSKNDPSNISATMLQLPEISQEDPYGAYFDSFKDQFADVFGAPENIETANLLLDSHEARQYVYSATFGGIEYKFWQVVCIRQGRVYTITYSSTANNYESHAADMQNVLDCFQFI